MRTSTTDPLRIATVPTGTGQGRIGVTSCPGRKDSAHSRGDRDLDRDLDAVRAWGAGLVVTLVEADELRMLGLPGLGDAVRARGMAWLHLPIRDMAVPDAGFEAAWIEAGAAIRARLRSGGDVVVHCRAGLGRAGMIAARLLAELGLPPETAIARVRALRPGAIETAAQAAHVRAVVAGPDPAADGARSSKRSDGTI